MDKDKDKDKDKDEVIYKNIMQVYRLDKDYCYTALDTLKQAIAINNRAREEERLDWLTRCLDDLTKTADTVAELLEERLKSMDEHSDKKEND